VQEFLPRRAVSRLALVREAEAVAEASTRAHAPAGELAAVQVRQVPVLTAVRLAERLSWLPLVVSSVLPE